MESTSCSRIFVKLKAGYSSGSTLPVQHSICVDFLYCAKARNTLSLNRITSIKIWQQLEEFEIVDIAPSRTCCNLRELNMCQGFEHIANTCPQDASEFSVWEEIGCNLERLNLQAQEEGDQVSEEEYDIPGVIESIKTHCGMLRNICIYDIFGYAEEILDLLTSYGDQLEYCHVEMQSRIRESSAS